MKCVSQPFTVGKLWVERNVIDESPPYQRESGLWSEERQQLFIDSVFNDLDVPKIYFHDIRGKHPTRHYAVIDGKQRLHTIWRFMEGKLRLSDDFTLADDLGHPPAPGGAVAFAELDAYWQETFKSKSLDIVLVQDAEEEDIEELFSRLNNGEPLNAAEKRNAMGGKMCELIREVAKNDFFSDRTRIPNKRFQHYELAAKILLIEKTEQDSGAIHCDLKKKYLDHLVDTNKGISTASAKGLATRCGTGLSLMKRVFTASDPLLAKQAYVPLYYMWVKLLAREYAHESLFGRMKVFLEKFNAQRQENLLLPEDERDPVLIEFGRLMQQGTNDLGSLETRVGILRRYYLQEYPDVTVKDPQRSFTEEERFAIWVLGGKKCAECGKALTDPSEMEADHKVQWAHGGPTTLENGRSLCEDCNVRLAKKIA
jgi:hypothetical protein